MIKTPLSTVIGGAFWTPGATVINGAKPGFETVMKKLFANGEQGFFYDPSDIEAMYQDVLGTTAVNASGQPVGLILDKSNGLTVSQNLLPQSSFAEGTTGWTLQSGWARAGDKVSNTTGVTALESPLQLVVGKLYRITLNTSRTSEGGTFSIRSGVTQDTQMVASSVDGIQSFLLRPTISTNTLRFQSIGWYGDVHSVEVVEVLGNHAYQTTSAARPILQNAPRRIDFDAVDDKLITNLPAQLTGCTVIRSVPGVGVQLLTNQTIPATYEDNTDHCGLIVINRALTPSETSAITSEFNKRAGV